MLALGGGGVAPAQEVPRAEASAPQGVTVSIYDTGLGMVNEARRVSLASGENDVVIGSLPVRIDPGSASYGTAVRAAPFDLLEQHMQYDFRDVASLLRRLVGEPVVATGDGTTREGVLLAGDLALTPELGPHVAVRSRDGADLWLLSPAELSTLRFPFSRDRLAVDPQLTWRVRARQEGPLNFRLAYRTEGLAWAAQYEVHLLADSPQADFSARVAVENQSGGRFENARLRLLLTEKGMTDPILPGPGDRAIDRPAMRYPYGGADPSFERSVASLAPLETYELPRTVTLEPDRTTFVHLVQAAAVPVRRFYVYDGVRFDRFQRNRRTDWNYGTEYHEAVQLHVEFDNQQRFGLGMNLPPGRCRLYQVRADGAVDLIGEERLMPMVAGGMGHVRVGPARGLTGQRERTGYVEVKPHHVYEESFEIRLANTTEDEAEIRVVEHLYRWPEFEVIRADADYTQTGPQTIEFRVPLKPGGRRTVHYTVRYSW
jgi:hypothetical protein